MEYLQNTVIGIINLDQNKIMKIFTLVSLLLMPPTLIASFFGMNVYFGEFVGNSIWAVVIIGALIISSIQNGLRLMQVTTESQSAIIGVVLIIAVAFDQMSKKRKKN